MSRKTKRNVEKPTATALSAGEGEEFHLSKQQIMYHSFMTIFWLASSISSAIIVFVAVAYVEEIKKIFFENTAIFIAYLSTYFIWKTYRSGSRSRIVSQPDFQKRMKSDFSFAQKFNNIEIAKTLVSYFLFSLPVLYASGLAKQIIEFFGVTSGGFAADLRDIALAIAASVFNLVLGLLCAYIYDKIKHKFP